ncbi:MAG: hypothetical protein ACOX8H_10860 [Ruminococcus sp.]|jgi:UPF0755 protein
MSRKGKQGEGGKFQRPGNRKGVRIAVYAAVLVIIGLAGRLSYGLGYAVFCQEPMTSEARAKEVEVTVQEGMSAYQIGKLLKSQGLIENPLIFWVQEELSDYRGELKSGRYTFNTAQTPDEMMAVMAAEPEEEEE